MAFILSFSDNDEPIEGESVHPQTARAKAVKAADESGRNVTVSSSSPGDHNGKPRARFVIYPGGRWVRPPGTREVPGLRREQCVRDSGRACFCTPCRSERRSREG